MRRRATTRHHHTPWLIVALTAALALTAGIQPTAPAPARHTASTTAAGSGSTDSDQQPAVDHDHTRPHAAPVHTPDAVTPAAVDLPPRAGPPSTPTPVRDSSGLVWPPNPPPD